MRASYVIIRVEKVGYESRNNLKGASNIQSVGATHKGVVLDGCGFYEVGEQVEVLRNQSYEVRDGVFAVLPQHVVYCGDLDVLIKNDK